MTLSTFSSNNSTTAFKQNKPLKRKGKKVKKVKKERQMLEEKQTGDNLTRETISETQE